MALELAEELNSEKPIKRHEEDKEQSDVVDLLTRAPKMKSKSILNSS